MHYVFLCLFVLISAAHLYASFRDDKRLRAWTKGGILLSLLGYYLFAAAGQIRWLVIVAILTSWLGDVFLIFRWGFAAGGVSFMISHLCFILIYWPNLVFSPSYWYVYALLALVYGTAVFFEFRALKGCMRKSLYYPMILYLVVNAAMNSAAFLQMLHVPCTATVFIFVGAALFFASDSILFLVRFHKTQLVWRRHFLVMLTYILAEFLIVRGILMLPA